MKKACTICFGLYGHHQVLILLCGNCCAHLDLFLFGPMYVLVYPMVMGRYPSVACVLLSIRVKFNFC
jgi:hypothetical protein